MCIIICQSKLCKQGTMEDVIESHTLWSTAGVHVVRSIVDFDQTMLWPCHVGKLAPPIDSHWHTFGSRLNY